MEVVVDAVERGSDFPGSVGVPPDERRHLAGCFLGGENVEGAGALGEPTPASGSQQRQHDHRVVLAGVANFFKRRIGWREPG